MTASFYNASVDPHARKSVMLQIKIVLIATVGMLDFAQNSLFSMVSSGIKTTDVVIFTPAAQRDFFEPLRSEFAFDLQSIEAIVSVDRSAFSDESYTQYGTKHFSNLMAIRAPILLELLRTYDYVVFADLDIYWLRNPLKYLASVLADYNIAMQTEANVMFPPPFCMGFMAFKKSNQSHEMLQWFQSSYGQDLSRNSAATMQVTFNRIIKDEPEKAKEIFPLPEGLFPNGRLYRLFLPRSEPKILAPLPEPFLFHANWTIGDTAKRVLLQQCGMWTSSAIREGDDRVARRRPQSPVLQSDPDNVKLSLEASGHAIEATLGSSVDLPVHRKPYDSDTVFDEQGLAFSNAENLLQLRRTRIELDAVNFTLAERCADLDSARMELSESRSSLKERSFHLDASLAELAENRITLVERSASLVSTLTELETLREALVERHKAHLATLSDLETARATLSERDSNLAAALTELAENRSALVERSANLAAALAEVVENRGFLVQRSSHLTEALAEIAILRKALIERNEAHVSTLDELEAAKQTSAQRDIDLGSALTELEENRFALVERSSNLALALAELVDNRTALVERSANLAAVLSELTTLRRVLVERDEAHTSTLTELNSARSALTERDVQLAAARAELDRRTDGQVTQI